jgi:hypothetical protein
MMVCEICHTRLGHTAKDWFGHEKATAKYELCEPRVWRSTG